MRNPVVGILMATYNGEKFISAQIDSILNQTYKDWKLVIHDDSSIDKTVEIIKTYQKKYPQKVIFIEDGIKCGGAKENFAHLLNIAKNKFNFDYIMFSDQDDIWLPEKIELTLIKMLELEKIHKKPLLVHTDLKVVDEKLNLLCDSFWKYQSLNPNMKQFNYLLVQNNVTGCTIIINRFLLYRACPIPKNAIMHDWWIALVASVFGEIIPLKESLVLYRQHKKNNIGAKKINTRYITLFMRDKTNNCMLQSIYKTFKQAEVFKKIFYGELNLQQKLVLDNYLSLIEKNFLEKTITVVKYKLLKHGILRNVGFFWCLKNGSNLLPKN